MKHIINTNQSDWANTDDYMKSLIQREMFSERIYERFFKVEDGDIVVDIGAHVGMFSLSSFKNSSPKYCILVEPMRANFLACLNNLKNLPVMFLNAGISKTPKFTCEWQNVSETCDGISFSSFIKLYNIEYIDFLKIDCEGGEYLIFTDDNFVFLKDNVKKIAMEVHLRNIHLKDKFVKFCEILHRFKNYKITSVDGIDITNRLRMSDDSINFDFVNYYNEILIFIDNR